MDQQDKDIQKPNDAVTSKDLLKKSAELKKRSALLKQQMEDTQKACNDMLHPVSKNSSDKDSAE